MRAASSWCAAAITAAGYYSVLTASAFELHWVLAYALMLAMLSWQLSDGWASPLGLFLVFTILRFAVPGLAALLSEIPAVGLFEVLRLDEGDWWAAHSLALLGISSVIWGWLAVRRNPAARFFAIVDGLGSGPSGRRLLLSGAALSGIGFVSLVAFVSLNSSGATTETVVAGTFRNEQVAEGTGIFFHVAIALIAGAVLQVAALRSLGYSRPVAILPALVAGLAFFALGGRARAMTPILGGLVALTAERRRKRNPLVTFAFYSAVLLAVVALGAVGQAYRGDYGITAFWSLPELLTGYIDYAIWFDIGQLHSLAAVVKLEPGILGSTIWVAALGGVARLLGWEGRSGGVFIVESLAGEMGRKWGVHSTLIGDSYLSIGLSGVVVMCFVFGAWLRALHTSRGGAPRPHPLAAAVHGLAVVYSLRVFFEAIDKVSEMAMATAFVLLGGVMARAMVPRNVMDEGHASTVVHARPR
jgi:hypothetical protein